MIGLSLNPAHAISYPVECSTININTSDSTITPFVDVGFGHYGSWSIEGNISYIYNGNQNYHYFDSGIILPIFSKYWGWKLKVPSIFAWNFTGTVKI